jgi:hypothetical protein
MGDYPMAVYELFLRALARVLPGPADPRAP